MSRRALSLLVAAGFAATAAAADWPQWRGPNRDGKSADTGLLQEWPKGGPKLLWKIDTLGGGYGAPAVVGDRIYILSGESATDFAPEYVVCLNVADGKELWRTKLAEQQTGPEGVQGKFRMYGGGPRSTPTVAGDFVYGLGGTGDLACVATSDGKLVWRKNLAADFGGRVPSWGYSESPLVDDGKVVCCAGGKGGAVALDAKTGDTVWRCRDLTDDAGYSSFVVAEVGGVRQYVTQTSVKGIGVRANDGKLLWRVGEIGRAIAVIPTPVVAGDGHVFFTAGYRAGCELYKLDPDGSGGTRATKVYSRNKVLDNQHGGVVEVGGYVYGYSDSQRWVCFDYRKGPDEPVWTSNKLGKGSVTYADGHLVCYAESDGTVALVKATPVGWQEAGRFTLPVKSKLRPPGGRFWPHPVVAHGRLYLRDTEHLCCYDVGRPGA
jgi:outer membrane protein assembly factor BamB